MSKKQQILVEIYNRLINLISKQEKVIKNCDKIDKIKKIIDE